MQYCFCVQILREILFIVFRYYGELVGDPSDSNNNTCGGDEASIGKQNNNFFKCQSQVNKNFWGKVPVIRKQNKFLKSSSHKKTK